MFTLFKIVMTKCILIKFISKQINNHTSNHSMFAVHKLLKIIPTNDHGMFAAHKSLKHQVWDDHGMFAAH